jgi:hypothetical protein
MIGFVEWLGSNSRDNPLDANFRDGVGFAGPAPAH